MTQEGWGNKTYRKLG
jgi:hypothetical protein